MTLTSQPVHRRAYDGVVPARPLTRSPARPLTVAGCRLPHLPAHSVSFDAYAFKYKDQNVPAPDLKDPNAGDAGTIYGRTRELSLSAAGFAALEAIAPRNMAPMAEVMGWASSDRAWRGPLNRVSTQDMDSRHMQRIRKTIGTTALEYERACVIASIRHKECTEVGSCLKPSSTRQFLPTTLLHRIGSTSGLFTDETPVWEAKSQSFSSRRKVIQVPNTTGMALAHPPMPGFHPMWRFMSRATADCAHAEMVAHQRRTMVQKFDTNKGVVGACMYGHCLPLVSRLLLDSAESGQSLDGCHVAPAEGTCGGLLVPRGWGQLAFTGSCDTPASATLAQRMHVASGVAHSVDAHSVTEVLSNLPHVHSVLLEHGLVRDCGSDMNTAVACVVLPHVEPDGTCVVRPRVVVDGTTVGVPTLLRELDVATAASASLQGVRDALRDVDCCFLATASVTKFKEVVGHMSRGMVSAHLPSLSSVHHAVLAMASSRGGPNLMTGPHISMVRSLVVSSITTMASPVVLDTLDHNVRPHWDVDIHAGDGVGCHIRVSAGAGANRSRKSKRSCADPHSAPSPTKFPRNSRSKKATCPSPQVGAMAPTASFGPLVHIPTTVPLPSTTGPLATAVRARLLGDFMARSRASRDAGVDRARAVLREILDTTAPTTAKLQHAAICCKIKAIKDEAPRWRDPILVMSAGGTPRASSPRLSELTSAML